MSLRERRDVVALAADGAQRGVLWSLVAIAGSSYRQPGACMVALADGRIAGTLSGGCLEADLLRRGEWTVRSGAVVERYSTAFDDTAEVPYGLGCGGEVEVLIEPLGTPEADALIAAFAASLRGERRVVVTLRPERGMLHRMVLDGRGDVAFASSALPTEDIVPLRRMALQGSGKKAALGDAVFAEHLEAAQRVVIFGAGEDAVPLSRMSAEMGWSTVVVDSRTRLAQPQRFPAAHSVVVAENAAGAGVLPTDAVVLMTHSFEWDGRLLQELLPLQPRYLGLLGARHRSSLLLQQAAAHAGLSMDEALKRVHAPVGLDLGGDGPQAVALAITAELQRTFAAANAQPRRMNATDVAEQLQRGPRLMPRGELCALGAVAVAS